MGPSGYSIIAVQIVWAIILVGRANDPFCYTERAVHEVQHGNYNITPLQLGVEVRGINLKGYVPPHVIDQIKSDVHKYGLMVFKNQGVITGARHAEITKWFGPLKVTFKVHNAQQHPQIFRVSNEDEIGNGKSISLGWHIDGALPKTIISHSLFHVLSLSKTSDTWFTSLYDLVDRMDMSTCSRFERLFVAVTSNKILYKPIIYSHPVTDKRTMIIYEGSFRNYVYDHGSPTEKITNERIAKSISGEMRHLIERDNHTHVYKHKWELGDFIIVDNQAVAHKAPRASSAPPEKVGLRVLNRASADSLKEPVKNYDPNTICGVIKLSSNVRDPLPSKTKRYESGQQNAKKSAAI